MVAAPGLPPILAAIAVGSRRHRFSLIYAALLVISVLWGGPYRLRYARFYVEDRPPLYERWTPTARITVFDQMNPQFLGWGMGLRYHGGPMDGHLWLDQDGSAGTPILVQGRTTVPRLPPAVRLPDAQYPQRLLACLGSWLAGRVSESRRRLAGCLVPVLVGAVVFLLTWVAGRTIAESLAVRVTLSVAALVVAGAMMGLPLPLGMAGFGDRDRRWFWAVNGATSVLASVLALVIALAAGSTVVLEGAVASYVVAALTLPGLRRPAYTGAAARITGSAVEPIVIRRPVADLVGRL